MSENLVLRSDKVAFYEVPGTTPVIHRMTGFTSASTSRNPKEYSRQYVDEKFETSSVTGYSPAIGYTFDQYSGNAVHDDIVTITDDEKTGTDAVRNIVTVDFSKEGTIAGTYVARKRAFSVIPDADGDGTDAYQYSGNFKVAGETIKGVATSADDWKTITFAESAGTTYLTTFNVSSAGGQVAGATVTIGTTSVTTDQNGIAEFALVNGTYSYSIAKTGYTTATGTVTVASEAEYTAVTLVTA